MKALVTGASGFTGGYLVKNLLEHGYQVRAFVRPTSKLDLLKELSVELAFGDIQSKEEILAASQNIDVVFHIAALYRSANVPDADYWGVNVIGTENVLEAALKSGVQRVVHCSTGGVHGHIENPPATEETPFNPGDVYQESKLEGERLALFYFNQKGLPVTVIRPIGIYGPGDMRMLKMYRMVQDRKFIMFGGGNALYHLTYVTDTVEGMRLASETPASIGQAYIIAGERYITLNQFAAMIAYELGVARPRLHFPVWPLYFAGFLCEKICVPLRIQPPIFRRRVDIFTKDRAFDISKAKGELGYQPKVDLEEGIRMTAKWYVDNGYLKRAATRQ
jgi:nucleoside-diphosphate-sugar epimerase